MRQNRRSGWGNYFPMGNAGREFNKMDYFVVKSLRRWEYLGADNGPRNIRRRLAISYTGWGCTR